MTDRPPSVTAPTADPPVGSVRFGTAGIRSTVPEGLDHHTAIHVGRAVAQTADASRPTVVVGYDSRVTGPALAAAVTAGLSWGGATVERAGMVPTPALAHASRGHLGVMVTASHNPPADNGIKVFDDGGDVDRERERAIEDAIRQPSPRRRWTSVGSVRDRRVLTAYRRSALAYLRTTATTLGLEGTDPLEGIRVAVDGGNGVAGGPASTILRELGAEVRTLGGNPDGHAPARASKPTAESLRTTRAWMRRLAEAGRNVDLGVAFDGDGDRLVVLDGDGSVVHEDTVLAVLAVHAVRHASAKRPTILTSPNASARIDDAVAAAGGRVERGPLGGLTSMARLLSSDPSFEDEIVLAAEPWKPQFPTFGPWIDAIVGAGIVALLTVDAGELASLTAPIASPPYEKRSVSCPPDRRSTVMDDLADRLREMFPDGTVTTAEDGLRVTFDRFEWLLIRPSGTEPVIRVYAEGTSTIDHELPRAIELLEALVDDE